MELDQLAPGVLGYTMEDGGVLYIPFILAEQEGNGDVGRYLDRLPGERTIRFPNVLSRRLAGMLSRRGFCLTREWAVQYGEWVPIWERRASSAPPGATEPEIP